MSPAHETEYADIIRIDSLDYSRYTIKQNPLSLVLELVYGIKDKPYWQKSYKAHWTINDDKLFLRNIISKDARFSYKQLFSTEMDEIGNPKKILANWYSGTLTIELKSSRRTIDSSIYDLIKERHYTICKGRVTEFTDTFSEILLPPF